ncbi:transposase [Paraburkholderia sp. Tr-20389]|uniref:helix-turn-helix domain-containing protein n=1 Tax=Paraburkholderia sp. Tr-20389 TaxID=2703903 RepID=UPI00197CE9A5|nr:helix-turn-helix domain-containing protein [Paraburkholderia sp. Tr-20389]MBN3755560.1 transposase [Paraburkholderia sp. Tr-20389]
MLNRPQTSDIRPTSLGVSFMAIYPYAFRQAVVDEYLSAGPSIRAVASKHSIDPSLLRRWIEAYRLHGPAGLWRKHTRYDAEFRLKVLKLIRKDGLSFREAAARFNIRSDSMIAEWSRRYESGGVLALAPDRRGRKSSGLVAGEVQHKRKTHQTHEHGRASANEVTQLRAEIAYLKEVERYPRYELALTTAEKVEIIQKLRPEYPLPAMLKAASWHAALFVTR